MKFSNYIPSKLNRKFLLSLSAISILGLTAATARDYYQLKVYNIETAEQEARMDAYLENACLPALHRAGVEHVGVFKPLVDGVQTSDKIYVVIPLEGLGQLVKLDEALKKDKEYRKAGADYINAPHDNPPYQRIESTILRAFKSFPEYGVPDHATPKSERVYELRSYEGATEKRYLKKVEMFDKGESEIFVRLGFQPIFFCETISGSSMPNLMYFTTFANQESRDAHWAAFQIDPKWVEMRSMEEYKNLVSKNTKFFLRPTDYSDM